MKPTRLTSPDGVPFRDLNHNGVMDPFEDPGRAVEDRVEDLLGRLSLEEKVGLMFHTVIEAGEDGTVLEGPAGSASRRRGSSFSASTSATSTCTPLPAPGWRHGGTTPSSGWPSRRRTASR